METLNSSSRATVIGFQRQRKSKAFLSAANPEPRVSVDEDVGLEAQVKETIKSRPDYWFPYIPLYRKRAMEVRLSVDDLVPRVSGDENVILVLQEGYKRKRNNSKWVPLKSLFGAEKPHYCIPITRQHFSLNVKKGDTLDVVTLLGKNNYLVRSDNTNGDKVKVESLEGKYILLCIYSAPCIWNGALVGYTRALSDASFELSGRDDFEIVMVAKMRRGWEDDEATFNQFVSAFSCLVVPFSDSRFCDFLCQTLNFEGRPKVFLVDPCAKIVQDHASFLKDVGAVAFPFTDDKLNFFDRETFKGKTIEGLLGCTYLTKSYSNGSYSGEETMLVSQLEDRVVGLYLCITGSLIPLLEEACQRCRARGLDFEIVVVCVPFIECMPQKLFQEIISSALKKRKISWWVWPFNNSTCRRLHNMSCSDEEDRLIIVGPHGKFLEPNGELVLRKVGVHAYPFTRHDFVDQQLERLREVRLESLLDGGYVYRKNNTAALAYESVAELRGRNVLLYLGKSAGRLSLLFELIQWYDQIKAKDPDFEVVFVPLDMKKNISEAHYGSNSNLSKMPWLIFSCSPSHLDLVSSALYITVSPWKEKLVAFGRDGQISSTSTEVLLRSCGSDAFPFFADVRNEVALDYAQEYGSPYQWY